MNWKPPDDPEKPSCPYIAGFELAVIEHDPPPPFGGGKYRGGPAPKPFEGYNTLTGYTQTRYCVRDLKPDDPTESLSLLAGLSDPTLHQTPLVIDSVIWGGHDAGAQVVVCHWNHDPNKTQYAAKIYDPLYYNSEQCDHPMPDDVVWNAERDYRIEAAAYAELRQYERQREATTPWDESKNIKGCYPTYFGSFTFNIKLISNGKTYTRTVPLILMEYLKAPSMANLMVEKVIKQPWGRGFKFETVIEVRGSDENRIHAFARAANSTLRLQMAGVGQADVAPRNTILVGELGSPTLRAVITDFNIASVYSRMTPPRSPPESVDPIRFCSGNWGDSFKGWLPRWFFEDKERRDEILKKEFSNWGK